MARTFKMTLAQMAGEQGYVVGTSFMAWDNFLIYLWDTLSLEQALPAKLTPLQDQFIWSELIRTQAVSLGFTRELTVQSMREAYALIQDYQLNWQQLLGY